MIDFPLGEGQGLCSFLDIGTLEQISDQLTASEDSVSWKITNVMTLDVQGPLDMIEDIPNGALHFCTRTLLIFF